jgi:hypothetical protein
MEMLSKLKRTESEVKLLKKKKSQFKRLVAEQNPKFIGIRESVVNNLMKLPLNQIRFGSLRIKAQRVF